MENLEIIKEIFSNKELTVEYDKTAILNKWHGIPIEIPIEVFRYLSEIDILEMDSGCFETGEIHYVYNYHPNKDLECVSDITQFTKYELGNLLKPILREVRLNNLLNEHRVF